MVGLTAQLTDRSGPPFSFLMPTLSGLLMMTWSFADGATFLVGYLVEKYALLL